MNAVEAIVAANRGRNPVLLALKWRRMRRSAFGFFRGTARLFYAQWSEQRVPAAPAVWLCGDAHPENVGSYRGDDRIAYFDINDFDEACIAPAHHDLGRALSALHLLRKARHARVFLEAYRQTLARGKPVHIEPQDARGPVAALLRQVKGRTQVQFLAKRVRHGKLRIHPERSYALDGATKKRARRIFEAWAKMQPDPKAYRLDDICGRIAGTGSLGLERYVLLVRGRRVPLIMDMKQASPPALLPFLKGAQPGWKSEAQRVARVQHLMQYVPIARLSWVRAGKRSFILRELQPVEDRIAIGKLKGPDYDKFVVDWARLLASGHIRGAGWKGSAKLGTLMDYAGGLSAAAKRRLLGAAARVARLQMKEHADFKANGPR